MSVPSSRSGWLLLAAALAWLACAHGLRLQRALHVTALENWSVASAADPRVIPTELNRDARETLLLARQGQRTGAWLVAIADYDNAPEGRPAAQPAAAPLTLRALAGTLGATAPSGLAALEWAALIAGPLLHLLVVALGALLVARSAGPWGAGLFALAVAGLYPFGTDFAPGVFDARTLASAAGALGLVALTLPNAGIIRLGLGATGLGLALICAPLSGLMLAVGAGSGALIAARRARSRLLVIGGLLATAVGAFASLGGTAGIGEDWAAWRLTHAHHSPVAENFLSLFSVAGGQGPALAWTLVTVAIGAGLLSLARRKDVDSLSAAIALGAVIAVAGLALFSVRDGRFFGVAVLGGWAAILAGIGRERLERTWLWWTIGAAFVLLPGFALDRPATAAAAQRQLTEAETRSLVARDLAAWLAQRTGERGAVVLAPPELSSALAYYGDLRGITSLAPENKAGATAAALIAAAKTRGEAETLLQKRGVRYVVLPTWDDVLDRQAAAARKEATPDGRAPANSFLGALRRLAPPPWLAPLAYPLPQGEGFASHAVTVFEVVEPMEPVVALCGLADYHLERNDVAAAEALLPQLEKYPGSPAALASVALIHAGRRDARSFQAASAALVALVEADPEIEVPWASRLGVCAVLSQARKTELGRAQLERFIAGLEPERIRRLSAAQALRLLTLAQVHRGTLSADVEARVREVVPPGMR
jgi:hypothetical protein